MAQIMASILIQAKMPLQLGEFAHKWTQIEKAILTKDFFFLYIKERNGYIISISNKDTETRNMKELIAFVENNVTQITKV